MITLKEKLNKRINESLDNLYNMGRTGFKTINQNQIVIMEALMALLPGPSIEDNLSRSERELKIVIDVIRELINAGIIDDDDIYVEKWAENFIKEKYEND